MTNEVGYPFMDNELYVMLRTARRVNSRVYGFRRGLRGVVRPCFTQRCTDRWQRLCGVGIGMLKEQFHTEKARLVELRLRSLYRIVLREYFVGPRQVYDDADGLRRVGEHHGTVVRGYAPIQRKDGAKSR